MPPKFGESFGSPKLEQRKEVNQSDPITFGCPCGKKFSGESVYKIHIKLNPKHVLENQFQNQEKNKKSHEKQKQVQPIFKLPLSYDNLPRQGDASGAGGTCALHVYDNIRRQREYEQGRDVLRMSSPDIIQSLNAIKLNNIPEAKLTENEMGDVLQRGGLNYQIKNATENLPAQIKDALGRGKKVIFEGIPYYRPDSAIYNTKQGQNLKATNKLSEEQRSQGLRKTDQSHVMNIIGLRSHSKSPEMDVSIDYLDSNNPGLSKGYMDKETKYIYEKAKTKKQKSRKTNEPIKFNLQNLRDNRFYEVD